MKKLNSILASGLLTALGFAIQNGGIVLQAADNEPQAAEAQQCPLAHLGTDHPTAYNQASHLIGMKVYNQTGQSLGRIKDIVIDCQTERVSYAVLAVRYGFMGLNQKLLAVPLGTFRTSNHGTHLVLNADRRSLELARGFPANQWPSPTAPSWGAAPPWKEGDAIEPSTSEMNKSHPPETIKPEKSIEETPDLYPPGTLGYPGW